MKYQIFYTDSAKQDLKNIYRYICDSLVEPDIAEKLTALAKCRNPQRDYTALERIMDEKYSTDL